MTMIKESTIADFGELHAAIRSRPPIATYRGVRDAKYELIPKVGRIRDHTIQREAAMLRLFKVHAIPHLTYHPRNDWEWIAIAQHHGFPTRLLDWSRNPLVAVFEGEAEKDGAVYVWEPLEALEEHPKVGPFEINASSLLQPLHITPRIAAQAGQFTIHPNPAQPFETPSLAKLVIPRDSKTQFRHDLFRYGVHRGALFPDLDGQAAFLDWYCTRWGKD